MADFKTIQLRPTTGAFDTLNSSDEVGFGNWRLVKNAVTRSSRNRQRSGGWRRLFADDSPYNNQDLHDQLVDRLAYFDSYTAHTMGGGGLGGYHYPYFAPAYELGGGQIFPPASGPFCPVYLGDFQLGSYNGCPIFYPFIGYPYQFVPSSVNTTGARAHWRMDTIAATTPDLFGGLNLSNLGATVTSGLIGNALNFTPGKWIGTDFYAAFQVGDISFGFTGWIYRTASGAYNKAVIDSWGAAPNRGYRLYLNSSEQLVFGVSSNGTTSTQVTNTTAVGLNEWVFFACWHDPVANTINLKINDGATTSVSYSSGVTAGTGVVAMGYDAETANALLSARLDAVTYWRTRFPSEAELLAIYNGGSGVGYPFSSGACNTGFPNYYSYSFLYTSCADDIPVVLHHGYPYGLGTPFYEPTFSYDYNYCGRSMHYLQGCREAVTMLQEIVTAAGRKLVAATMSRVYELNQSSGNWSILADGLGNSGYTVDQCTCNSVRGMSATLGSYLIFTNGFDGPSTYVLGDAVSGCGLQGLQTITDFVALGITRAGGVVSWRGFVIFYDFTENGERMGGTVIWGDLESATSFIESDTSLAGRATIAVGETILNAAPLGNAMMFYTDKSIIRCTLVGGDDVFNFEILYHGGNALKYKFSLINGGDLHLWLGESDVYGLSQFDSRPITIPWITKAAGMIFNGITEDHAIYEPINKEACNLVTGGWSDEAREAWLSWPTGDNICPNVTLRFNVKFSAADFIDHGFTSFLTFRKDNRPTIGQWLEDLGVCPRGTLVASGIKDGDVCTGADVAVQNPPLFIWNEAENPNLAIDPNSLCARLQGKTIADFCEDCAAASTFIVASAEDFALKQAEDDIGYREMLGGSPLSYDGYACHGEFYHHVGYQTVMQQGAENYRDDDEKMMKMIAVEAEPLPQSTPSILTAEAGYGSQPSCLTWKPTRDLEFECQTSLTPAQHVTRKTRPDGMFYFPCWRRGRYLSSRFIIDGIGGLGKFSAMSFMIKPWGQQDTP